MKIFISWSGEISHQAAIALKTFLKRVIQATEPYVSSSDIDKGARWFDDISDHLDACQFGILCLTKENLTSNWIHFEAGALAKNVSRSKVAPLLIDLTPADVVPPLSQFQLTKLVETDVYQLIEQINLGSANLPVEDLQEAFSVWWPKLEREVEAARTRDTKATLRTPERSDRELLEELLQLTRSNDRAVNAASSSSLADYAAYNDQAVETAILDTLYPDKAYQLEKLYNQFIFPPELVFQACGVMAHKGYITVDRYLASVSLTPRGKEVYLGRSRQALRGSGAKLDEED